MATYRPRWAIMKVVDQSEDRLELYYNPLAYALLGGGFALLCLIAWIGSGNWIWFGAALIFGGAFVLLFYRRVRLILDRSTGTITHSKILALFWRFEETYPLESLIKATVDTSYTGDTAMHRAVLMFSDRDAVPVTRGYLSGPNGIEVSGWINVWLEAKDT